MPVLPSAVVYTYLYVCGLKDRAGRSKFSWNFFFSSCETPPLDRAPLARDWIEQPLHENKSGVTWSSTSGTLSDQPEASEPLRNCVTVPYGPEGASMPNSQSFRSIIFSLTPPLHCRQARWLIQSTGGQSLLAMGLLEKKEPRAVPR